MREEGRGRKAGSQSTYQGTGPCSRPSRSGRPWCRAWAVLGAWWPWLRCVVVGGCSCLCLGACFCAERQQRTRDGPRAKKSVVEDLARGRESGPKSFSVRAHISLICSLLYPTQQHDGRRPSMAHTPGFAWTEGSINFRPTHTTTKPTDRSLLIAYRRAQASNPSNAAPTDPAAAARQQPPQQDPPPPPWAHGNSGAPPPPARGAGGRGPGPPRRARAAGHGRLPQRVDALAVPQPVHGA